MCYHNIKEPFSQTKNMNFGNLVGYPSESEPESSQEINSVPGTPQDVPGTSLDIAATQVEEVSPTEEEPETEVEDDEDDLENAPGQDELSDGLVEEEADDEEPDDEEADEEQKGMMEFDEEESVEGAQSVVSEDLYENGPDDSDDAAQGEEEDEEEKVVVRVQEKDDVDLYDEESVVDESGKKHQRTKEEPKRGINLQTDAAMASDYEDDADLSDDSFIVRPNDEEYLEEEELNADAKAYLKMFKNRASLGKTFDKALMEPEERDEYEKGMKKMENLDTKLTIEMFMKKKKQQRALEKEELARLKAEQSLDDKTAKKMARKIAKQKMLEIDLKYKKPVEDDDNLDNDRPVVKKPAAPKRRLVSAADMIKEAMKAQEEEEAQKKAQKAQKEPQMAEEEEEEEEDEGWVEDPALKDVPVVGSSRVTTKTRKRGNPLSEAKFTRGLFAYSNLPGGKELLKVKQNLSVAGFRIAYDVTESEEGHPLSNRRLHEDAMTIDGVLFERQKNVDLEVNGDVRYFIKVVESLGPKNDANILELNKALWFSTTDFTTYDSQVDTCVTISPRSFKNIFWKNHAPKIEGFASSPSFVTSEEIVTTRPLTYSEVAPRYEGKVFAIVNAPTMGIALVFTSQVNVYEDTEVFIYNYALKRHVHTFSKIAQLDRNVLKYLDVENLKIVNRAIEKEYRIPNELTNTKEVSVFDGPLGLKNRVMVRQNGQRLGNFQEFNDEVEMRDVLHESGYGPKYFFEVLLLNPKTGEYVQFSCKQKSEGPVMDRLSDTSVSLADKAMLFNTIAKTLEGHIYKGFICEDFSLEKMALYWSKKKGSLIPSMVEISDEKCREDHLPGIRLATTRFWSILVDSMLLLDVLTHIKDRYLDEDCFDAVVYALFVDKVSRFKVKTYNFTHVNSKAIADDFLLIEQFPKLQKTLNSDLGKMLGSVKRGVEMFEVEESVRDDYLQELTKLLQYCMYYFKVSFGEDINDHNPDVELRRTILVKFETLDKLKNFTKRMIEDVEHRKREENPTKKSKRKIVNDEEEEPVEGQPTGLELLDEEDEELLTEDEDDQIIGAMGPKDRDVDEFLNGEVPEGTKPRRNRFLFNPNEEEEEEAPKPKRRIALMLIDTPTTEQANEFFNAPDVPNPVQKRKTNVVSSDDEEELQ
jgi:hypothetical protein